jgi:pimeloyl-ACP methyl ester carboxylesterase
MPHDFPDNYIREYSHVGSPVILIGDILGGGGSWKSHAEILSSSWRVIVISPLLVAYAAQGRFPPEPWDIAVEGDALSGLMDSLNLTEAHIAGWSLGGAIALNFTLANTKRVKSLLLVEPQTRWILRRSGFAQDPDPYVLETMRDFASKDIDEEMLVRFLHVTGSFPADQDPRKSRAWPTLWTNRLSIANAWRINEHDGDFERLASLTMPTLICRGDTTTVSNKAISKCLVRLLPDAIEITLPGGHNSHMVARKEFLQHYSRTLMDGEK